MSVTAGTWTLSRTTSEAVESFFGLHEEGNEAVFEDYRELVDRKHFAPGGKYHCKYPKPLHTILIPLTDTSHR